MAVHNLVQGLELPYRGSVDASQSQALSPDATLALLVDLLRLMCEARGRAFDPLQMAELSGLECGYLRATGDYVWAHREEIQGRSSDIRFAHKSSSDVSSLKSAAISTDSVSLSPLEPHPLEVSESQCRSLRIVDVRDLRKGKSIGTQSPYCKWTLSSAESGVIAVGRTDVHKNGGTSPNWGVQVFALRLPSSPSQVTLVVSVRCAGVVPGTKYVHYRF
ncbi:hypothetical protein PINS_up013094 [Pythium insidiosum]|nr:hypothetical protein PINS_up013094 [Pythium insidiosum]